MADFKAAFDRTLGHEGGYANDPDDAGGETYKGIARRFHPDWAGWPLLDGHKQAGAGFRDALEDDGTLQVHVRNFYKAKFWDRLLGDRIPDQAIAEEMFDTAVNMGTGRAVMFLQDGLNLLNRNGTSYDDISVDGGFGTKTLDALNTLLTIGDGASLLKILNILQGAHYLDYMRKAPVQEKYARGWLKRVEISKA